MVNAGYIPVKNVQVKETEIIPYNQLGTGKTKTNEKADDYYYSASLLNTVYGSSNGQITEELKISGLKDKQLEEKINNFIAESEQKLQDKMSECDNYVKLLNQKEYQEMDWKVDEEEYQIYTNNRIVKNAECINGYLSVQVTLEYCYNIQKGEEFIYDGYSKVYDLYTGEELLLSDLYYKDVEFISSLNEKIEKRIPWEVEMGDRPIATKRTFSSLPQDIEIYGLDTITFTKNNPYFVEGVKFDTNTYLDNLSIIYEARDMEGLFEDNIQIYKNVYYNWMNTKIDKKETQNNIYNIYYSDMHNINLDNAVNSYIDNNIINDEKIENWIKTYINENPENAEYINYNPGEKREITVNTLLYGKKYISIQTNVGFDCLLNETIFDLETGNQVTEEEVLRWEEEIDS